MILAGRTEITGNSELNGTVEVGRRPICFECSGKWLYNHIKVSGKQGSVKQKLGTS